MWGGRREKIREEKDGEGKGREGGVRTERLRVG